MFRKLQPYSNPICGKIIERFLFLLLSITHEIYKSFDDVFDVRTVFLDISKVFDKVWHEVAIFKLRQYGLVGKILNTLCDFLRNRKQRVVLH